MAERERDLFYILYFNELAYTPALCTCLLMNSSIIKKKPGRILFFAVPKNMHRKEKTHIRSNIHCSLCVSGGGEMASEPRMGSITQFQLTRTAISARTTCCDESFFNLPLQYFVLLFCSLRIENILA